MYFQNTLQEKIYITTDELNRCNKKNIHKQILKKIKHKIGNKCYKYGLILEDSIKIINRSMGVFNDSHFNASISMMIKFEAKICNPNEGLILECYPISSNKMGTLCSITEDINKSPLIILLAKQHHIDNKHFKNIKVGKKIYITVVGKKFDLNDRQISVIGKLSKQTEYNKQNNIENNIEELEMDYNGNEDETIHYNNE